MKTAIYIRGDDTTSLAQQLFRVYKYAHNKGYEMTEGWVYGDVTSANQVLHKEYKKLIADASEAKFDFILVTSLDVLVPSFEETVQLITALQDSRVGVEVVN
jgi:DNA invertase Pin-like site-specific DNA recombinase